MKTIDDVVAGFTPVAKLNDVQKNAILKLQIAFTDFVGEMKTLTPYSSDSVTGYQKLLEAKIMFVQSITHEVVAAPAKKVASEK